MIQYTGATNTPATVLTLGDGGTTRNREKLYLGLQVTRQIWSCRVFMPLRLLV
jgi:hypothetical protein